MLELNKIYNEDCLATMQRMEDNSVDLIITSPPYNKNAYAVGSGSAKSWSALRGRQIPYDKYNDAMPPEEYEKWQKDVISECLRILKPHGSLFYNHKDILVGGVIVPPKWVYEFPIHQQIIWNRGSSLANDPHYFQPITEYIYWIAKSPKDVFFDKSKCAFRQSVWNINFEINTKHPAPFPKKLVGNIILGCSKEGDIIYDPYFGSGTTGLMAAKMKRNWIGSEISENYVQLANKRIKNETSQLSLF
jgi:modification methylase